MPHSRAGRETSRVKVVDAAGTQQVVIEFTTIALGSTCNVSAFEQTASGSFYELDDGTPVTRLPRDVFLVHATGAVLRRL